MNNEGDMYDAYIFRDKKDKQFTRCLKERLSDMSLHSYDELPFGVIVSDARLGALLEKSKKIILVISENTLNCTECKNMIKMYIEQFEKLQGKNKVVPLVLTEVTIEVIKIVQWKKRIESVKYSDLENNLEAPWIDDLKRALQSDSKFKSKYTLMKFMKII